MAGKRKNPIAQAGNYSAEIDTTGMDPEMKATLVPTPAAHKDLHVHR